MLLFAAAVLLLVLALLIVSYPLVFHPLEAYRPPERGEMPLEDERDALLEALSELDLAHGSAKVSDPDYERQKARLEAEYIRVVKALGDTPEAEEEDESASTTPPAPEPPKPA